MPEASIVDAIARFVATVGVPAAIALLMLWRLNGRLEKLVTHIAELNKNISILMERGSGSDQVKHSIEKLVGQLDVWEDRWRNKDMTGWQTPKKRGD